MILLLPVLLPFLFSPLIFYPLVLLGGLVLLSIAAPIFNMFVAGTLIKVLFMFGGVAVSYLIFKSMSKGRVPIISGIFQIIGVMLLGLLLPNLLSWVGLQSISVPTMSLLGGDRIIMPFEIPAASLWLLVVVLFLIFLETQRKIRRRFEI